MARELRSAAQQVREGRALAMAMSDSGAFPDVAIKMVEVGESTGALQEMLNSLADFYDEEIETNLGRFVTLVEPILLVDHGHGDRRLAAVAVHAALQSARRCACDARPRDRGALNQGREIADITHRHHRARERA